MTYQEEEQVRLIRQRSKQAIALAMEGRWREAVAANKGLIESFPSDVDSYNRLGRAYMELGMYALARESYQKALELDIYNAIAQKNLQRLAHLGEEVGAEEGGEPAADGAVAGLEEAGEGGVALPAAFGAEAVDVGEEDFLGEGEVGEVEDVGGDPEVGFYPALRFGRLLRLGDHVRSFHKKNCPPIIGTMLHVLCENSGFSWGGEGGKSLACNG